jgi:hypothetical protein
MKLQVVIALAFAVFVAGVNNGDAEPDAIRARVRVIKTWAPGEVEIFVTVPPAAANHGYEVIGYCNGVPEQRSFRELHGADSQGPFDPVKWRGLPGCQYAIDVVLLGAGSRPIDRLRAPLPARVLCAHCDPEPNRDPIEEEESF